MDELPRTSAVCIDTEQSDVLQSLVAVAGEYVASRRAFGESSAGRSGPATPIQLRQPDEIALRAELQATYQRLAPGDAIVVDLPAGLRAPQSSHRDMLARSLFAAGFEAPVIWAGRHVLVAENEGSILNRLLSSKALGGGPSVTLADGRRPDVAPDQLTAIAIRSAAPFPRDRNLRLSVVMPVYNEKATFCEVVELLLQKQIAGFDLEICIVESNSTDGTREEVAKYSDHPRVRVLFEDNPQGKGHAVRNGLRLATGDIILIQDADLEYDLADYEKLLAPIANGTASFVLGSRHPAGESGWQLRQFADQEHLSDVLNVGHLFFTWLFNTTFSQSLRDPFTMYKVFRRDCINSLLFECNRFDFDFELAAKLVRNGFRPIEIDVHYKSRSFKEGKKVSFFRDPPTWIKACIRHRFSRLHSWPETAANA